MIEKIDKIYSLILFDTFLLVVIFIYLIIKLLIGVIYSLYVNK